MAKMKIEIDDIIEIDGKQAKKKAKQAVNQLTPRPDGNKVDGKASWKGIHCTHTDRARNAHGLCKSCYITAWRNERKKKLTRSGGE